MRYSILEGSPQDAMRRATTRKGAEEVLSRVEMRIAELEQRVHWPALEESWKRDLAEAREIGRGRGLLGGTAT